MSTNIDCQNKIIQGFFNLIRDKINDNPEDREKAVAEYTNRITEGEQCLKLIGCSELREKLCKQLAIVYNERGFVKYLKVDFSEAMQDYTKALSYDKGLYYTYYNRGLIHYRLGRFDEAVDDMKRSVTIKPDFDSAQKCLQQAQIDRQTKNKTAA